MRALARVLFLLAAMVGLLVAPVAPAQVIFFNNLRVGQVVTYHTTVSTSAAIAIPSASVINNGLGWQVCNDAVNTSTYLQVSQGSSPSTTGVQLAPGACFTCPNCTPATLRNAYVIAQAASNGYSVLQFRQR